MAGGPRAELVERRREMLEGRLAVHTLAGAALHRAENRRRTETAGGVDDLRDEGAGPRPDARVGVAEVQTVPDPPRAGAHRREAEAEITEEVPEERPGKRLGAPAGREDLDRIEAEVRGEPAAGLQPALERGGRPGQARRLACRELPGVEDERAATRLGHQADRDGRAHRVTRGRADAGAARGCCR